MFQEDKNYVSVIPDEIIDSYGTIMTPPEFHFNRDDIRCGNKTCGKSQVFCWSILIYMLLQDSMKAAKRIVNQNMNVFVERGLPYLKGLVVVRY